MTIQMRLKGEPLEEYTLPFGGGFFFTLPGVADEQDWLGRTLLALASQRVARANLSRAASTRQKSCCLPSTKVTGICSPYCFISAGSVRDVDVVVGLT